MLCVPLEVLVESQNLPLPLQGDRADEKIHAGTADAGGPTLIMDASRFLVVFSRQSCVFKKLQVLPHPPELIFIPNTGEHFLTDRSNNFCPAFSD